MSRKEFMNMTRQGKRKPLQRLLIDVQQIDELRENSLSAESTLNRTTDEPTSPASLCMPCSFQPSSRQISPIFSNLQQNPSIDPVKPRFIG